MSSKIVARRISIVVFALFMASASLTGCGRDRGENDLGNAVNAYGKGKFEEAAKYFKAAAEKGNAEAQYSFGVCLQLGRGVEKDMKQSFDWVRKAAEQGHAKAQFMLGYYYEHGLGVEKNPAEAKKWFDKCIDALRMLAAQGDDDARKFVADYIEHNYGQGTSTADPAPAGEPDDAEGQYKLALRYARGEGVGANIEKSFQWMRKAAEQGHAKAQCLLGIYYETGVGVERDSAEAKKWFDKCIVEIYKLAEQGDVEAQSCLSACYENGFGIEKDEQKALEWLRKAADRGDVSSQLNLGVKYLNARDAENALVWLRKAADQGSVLAQFSLGNLFEAGMGSVKADKDEAVKWFRIVAESDDALLKKAAQDALKRLESPAGAGK